MELSGRTEAATQAARAAEILRPAHAAFAGSSTKEAAEVADYVDKAISQLTKAASGIAEGAFGEAVRLSNGWLGTALEKAKAAPRPPGVEEESVEAIARSLALIHTLTIPIARASAAPSSAQPVEGHERRSSPRAVLETGVGFESDSNFYTGFTEDISEGGLFVATFQLLPVGTELDMSLALPTGRIINTKMVVRWVREADPNEPGVSSGMGCQFLDLGADDQQAISEFIKARAPIFYDEWTGEMPQP